MITHPALQAQLQHSADAVSSALWHIFLTVGLPLMVFTLIVQVLVNMMKTRRKTRRSRQRPPSKFELLFPELQKTAKPKFTARRPLTSREEKMFIVLADALPECTVLAQVSFQALIDTPSFEDRNRFNRKYADFVICSKRLTPIAVIELDDSTHDNKQARDADRDAMLQGAGYQTIRYRDIPVTSQIREDIQNAIIKLQALQPLTASSP